MRVFIIMVMLALAALVPMVQAASSVSESTTAMRGSDVMVTSLACTTDTDGSFSAHTLDTIRGYLLQMTVDPDTSSAGAYPTDQYDITLTNELGADVLGNAAADLDSSISKIVLPKPDGTNVSPVLITDDLSFDILNNSVNGAVINVRFEWIKR